MNDTPAPQGTSIGTPEAGLSAVELLKEAVWTECSTLLGTEQTAEKDASLSIEFGDLIARVPREKLLALLEVLRDSKLQFSMLLDVTAVDWMDLREDRFELVYQLLSLTNTTRITVKVPVSESSVEVDSVTSLFRSANFLEREVWDMFGITFKGHPNLRRILLYEEFKGHPLRKDYPVQGKQPRIPLRMPEVENTARQMKRADLVAIRSKKSADAANHNG